MPVLKCIGCYNLKRERLATRKESSLRLTVYHCERFPYPCAISGLLRPSKDINEAVSTCRQSINEHCMLCDEKPNISYGEPPLAHMCKTHDEAWKKYLEDYPEEMVRLAPKGKLNKTAWVIVFREFIEKMRERRST